MTAILAPYFHLCSLVTVLSPLLYTTIFLVAVKIYHKQVQTAVNVKLKSLAYCGILVLIGISAWFIPAFDSLQAISQKVGSGFINHKTILGSLKLFKVVPFFIYGK